MLEFLIDVGLAFCCVFIGLMLVPLFFKFMELMELVLLPFLRFLEWWYGLWLD